jgi:hypothetical protein
MIRAVAAVAVALGLLAVPSGAAAQLRCSGDAVWPCEKITSPRGRPVGAT